jgi:hypothetical protein
MLSMLAGDMRMIGKFALLMALLSVGFFHGHVFGKTDKPYSMVYVKSCDDRFADIYSDKEMTTPMPNPVVSDYRGEFSVFTSERCVVVR